jgi:Phage integrase family
LIADVDERRRASDGRLRRAIPHSTSWWVTVRYGKRGRRRAVPLEHDALDAIAAWVKARPTCAHEQLLVSLPRTGRDPQPLTVRDVTRIVARYAQLAELPEDRRSPHVLRHTFCTHLAESDEPIEVIRELVGHADIRTTTIYTDVFPRPPPERDRRRRPPPARPRPPAGLDAPLSITGTDPTTIHSVAHGVRIAPRRETDHRTGQMRHRIASNDGSPATPPRISVIDRYPDSVSLRSATRFPRNSGL